MALEDLTGTGKFITSLVPANPSSSDDRREGDDHIRGIKNVLRNTFPGLDKPIELAFCPLAGGVLTGPLAIAPAAGDASLTLSAAGVGANSPLIMSVRGGKNRWAVWLGTGAESGGGTGGVFQIARFDDAGSYVGSTFYIERQRGRVVANYGYGCKQGSAGAAALDSNAFNFYWNGSGMESWVDSTKLGVITVTSDERVKKQIEPLEPDALAFLQIGPITYRWAEVGAFKDDGARRAGFSAQNLMQCVPQAVVGNITAVQADGTPQPASVDLAPILAQTVLQVQALMRRVQALEAR